MLMRRRMMASVTFFVFFLTVFLGTGFLAPSLSLSSPGDRWVVGADSMVADDPSYQGEPSVNGDLVVWTDCRQENQGCSIFYRDLSTENPEEELTPGLDHQSQAIGAGNIVAWQQLVSPPAGGAGYQIYYKRLGSDEAHPIADGTYQQYSPAVSGGRVVWTDEREGTWESDIYMVDFASGIEQALCTESSRQEQPDIAGDWVVWTDNRGGVFMYGKPTRNDIYAKNVVTGEERRLTFDMNAVIQNNPALGRDQESGAYRAVWEGDGIWLYDFNSGETKQISGTGNRPDIDGDVIVWSDPDTREIKLHDLSTGVTQTLSEVARTYYASISGERIVWADDRNKSQDNSDNRDIYQNRLGARAEELAERYRPELRMAPDENFEPLPVEQLLSAPGTFLRKRDDAVFEAVANPDFQDLASAAATQDLYLDLEGDAVLAGGGDTSLSIDRSYIYQNYVIPYDERRSLFPSTLYARLVKDAQGSGGTAIQYWLCYAANDFSESFHEGDWELVQVELDGDLQPVRADYSHHGGGSWRNWELVEKSWRYPDQPVVYVAAGSHANYFYAGEFPIFLQSWDTTSGGGSTLYPRVEVLPEAGVASASSYGWLDFTGQWGEYTGAKTGIGFLAIGGLRDGPDNPPVQGYWNNPFSWPGITCDGCRDEVGEGTDLELTSHSPVDIHLYDLSGRHVGVNSEGIVELQIPGAEYLAYPEQDRTSIVIHGGDINDGYRMEVNGAGSGPCELILTAPDQANGFVETLGYSLNQVNPQTTAFMDIASGNDFLLHIDYDGSGLFVTQPPASAETQTADFIPPARITDLSAVAGTSGSVTLSFTAPGDDADDGKARQYDLRYSTAPVTDASWKDAYPVVGVPQPLAAGSSQTATVTGLDSGTTYYFALRTEDDAALASPISNVVETATLKPQLTWEEERVYWASWSDYISSELSVDYRLENSGREQVYDLTVLSSTCSPAAVHLKSSMPVLAGALVPGKMIVITLRYFVPEAVVNFTTKTTANCRDATDKTYQFPE